MGKEGGKTRPPTTLTFHFLSINIPGSGGWPPAIGPDHRRKIIFPSAISIRYCPR